MYGIKITYSWGDEEPIYGSFKTEEDAYAKACELAGKEAYVQNEEMDEDETCTVYFDGYEKRIDLHYDCDGEECYYRIVKIKE